MLRKQIISLFCLFVLLTACDTQGSRIKSWCTKKNQDCISKLTESSWLGEQRRILFDQVVGNGKYAEDETTALGLSEKCVNNHVCFITIGWSLHTPEWVSFSDQRIVDTRTQQVLVLSDLVAPDKLAALKQDLRAAFEDRLRQDEGLSYWGTPANDAERQKWLNENLADILDKYGTPAVENGKITAVQYCSSGGTNQHAYFPCVTLPTQPYFEKEYLPEESL